MFPVSTIEEGIGALSYLKYAIDAYIFILVEASLMDGL